MRRITVPMAGSVLALLALFAALSGTGYALVTGGIPDARGVFHGCVDRKTGDVRLVSDASKCRNAKGHGKHRYLGEFAVSWSQTGPAGKHGADGTKGTNGANGTNGTNGTPATRLWASVQNPGGVPSVLHGSGVTSVSNNGAAGETKVTFNQDVSQCAFQATVVSAGGTYYTPPNEISVFTGFYSGSGLTNNQVVVTTVHSTTLTNGYNFAITAFC